MKLPRENGREEKSPRSIPMLNAVDKDKNREMTIVSVAQRFFFFFFFFFNLRPQGLFSTIFFSFGLFAISWAPPVAHRRFPG